MTSFTAVDIPDLCDELCRQDDDFRMIVDRFGYPPFWSRPNTFESLVHIILEQQVSLASARAALEALRAGIGMVTPEAVLRLTDAELKAFYFSRQKARYVRATAEALLEGNLDLTELTTLPDDIVRARLTVLPGIGNWTVDIYLMMVLHRRDIFPAGDLAAINALKRLKHIPPDTPKDAILKLTEAWQPNRTLATFLLWHFYLSS